ncbi:hybrid sensor histidine kinase/response regulator [Phaeovulum vinaykumarii]|uniref:histidine kinase n=1 Tax=Phaeovulum vinaykumarii TaxID=407234 RepID=A0A1N7MKT4_9RHOB|nr:response regulator [Phaeovulum vinaykumarii]SIS86608.1 PAS/PAC sensor hybrid histidine kinase [Phaeovulum vinaykumarii]SOC13494.1 PAS/PAC sensor hybrid histidine kinase [Phaeovulum vinaykumarii]
MRRPPGSRAPAELALRIFPWLVPLLGVVLLGVAVLLFSANQINRNLERNQAARTDNTSWVVAQAEVDLLKLQRALDATAESRMLTDTNLATLRQRFDVFYSRIDVIGRNLAQQDWFGAPELRQQWDTLRGHLRDQAALIDAPPLLLAESLPALRADLARQSTAVRAFTLDALLQTVERSDAERHALNGLLARFSVAALLLIGLLVGATWVMVVLTRRLQARALATERIRSNLEKTIDASLDAVIVADARGHITHFNAAAEAIFGYSRAEAVGRDYIDMLVPERMRAMRAQALAEFHRTGTGVLANRGRVVVPSLRKDGTEVPIEVVVISDRDATGEPVFFSFVRDISDQMRIETNLKRSRDAALRSEEAKTRFLAVMSHEMRTPMNGLIAALDIVLRTTDLTEKQRHFLAIARSCSANALEQINDVLEISRLDSGNAPEAPSAFDLCRMLREAAEQGRPLAEQRGNTVHLRLPDDAPARVTGHRRLFARVLGNLLGNALKFTRDGRIDLRLALTPRPGGGWIARVEVEDTGIGIAEDKLDRIFNAFETLDSGYDRATEGTGLGLGIARRAARLMGGDVGVESRLGAGSLFWFTARLDPAGADLPDTVDDLTDAFPLPASLTTPAPSGALPDDTPGTDTPSGPRPDGLDVLVVEDNPVNRIVLREMLQHLGHGVTEAVNGAEAVEMARAHAFDLIFMDISMPVMDGVAATRALRAEPGASDGVPIVGLTAHTLPEELQRFAQAGLDPVLTKPITLNALRIFLEGAPDQEIPPPAPPQIPPVLDVAVRNDLASALPPEVLHQTADRFLSEIAAFLEDLARQIEAGDHDRIAATAHKGCGSASVFGAPRLVAALRRIETQAKQGNAAGGDQAPLLAAARAELDAVRAALAAEDRPAIAV